MKKVVLTGGPCGGKTECLNEVSRRFGDLILVIPESATIFLGKNPKPPNNYPDWRSALMADSQLRKTFQKEVLRSQNELEKIKEIQARSEGRKIIVCDRGILDGAAYWPGGLPDFLAHFQLDIEECHSRYQRIIHLESWVMAGTGFFSNKTNQHRFEDPEEARHRELLTREVWDQHPARIIIPVQEMSQKKRATLEEVARLLDES